MADVWVIVDRDMALCNMRCYPTREDGVKYVTEHMPYLTVVDDSDPCEVGQCYVTKLYRQPA